MKLSKLVSVGLAALGIAAGAAVNASELRFSTDGGTTWSTCADGAACDLNGTADVITVVGSFGAFDINVTTGLGGDASATNLIDLNSVDVSSGAGGLIIEFSDIGYTDIGLINGYWGGTVSGLGSVSAYAYADMSNLLYGTSDLLGSAGPFSGGAFAASFSGNSPASGPYSLTQRLVLTATGPMSYSGDFELTVPEPGALALLGIGLAGVGFMRRRREV